jgi:hypothetical protein
MGGPEIPVLIGLAQGINGRYRSQEKYAGSDAGSGLAQNGGPSDVQMKGEAELAFSGALDDISALLPGDGSQAQLQTELNQQIQAEALAASTSLPLGSKTILVRNLTDPTYNGLCAVKDLLPNRGNDGTDAEIDNLDFLRQDCCYIPEQHVLTCGDAGDKLFINSQWSWRAALREISRMEPQCTRFIFELTEKGGSESRSGCFYPVLFVLIRLPQSMVYTNPLVSDPVATPKLMGRAVSSCNLM